MIDNEEQPKLLHNSASFSMIFMITVVFTCHNFFQIYLPIEIIGLAIHAYYMGFNFNGTCQKISLITNCS